MRFVSRAAKRGDKLVDPLASELMQIGGACSGVGGEDVPKFLALRPHLPSLLVTRAEIHRPANRSLRWPEHTQS